MPEKSADSDAPASLLESSEPLILDGGLATELEARGKNLDHPLWSAQILASDPEAIREVHRRYLEAGADCIIGASYQASLRGLAEAGYSPGEAKQLLELSVRIANQERDAYWQREGSRGARPLVAASVGPFGAYLADGSEFRGQYGVDPAELEEFHRRRLELLWQAGPDLLAIETLPCFEELEVLLGLLERMPGARAWISFSCRDGRHINDGTPIRRCAALCAEVEAIWGVGVNCTAPHFVSQLIGELNASAPAKNIVVYPNSGEVFDGQSRSWVGESDPTDFASAARRWVAEGASMVGGCCRTGPGHIREIRQALRG